VTSTSTVTAVGARSSADASLPALLFAAYRSMESKIFGALHQVGYDDVTPAQARVFRVIQSDGSRLTDVADAAHVTKQTAGFLVDQLVRAGYVTRVPDPADARARLIKIAPRGAAVIPVAAAVVAKAEAEWTALLGSDRMHTLQEILQTLWDATEPMH